MLPGRFAIAGTDRYDWTKLLQFFSRASTDSKTGKGSRNYPRKLQWKHDLRTPEFAPSRGRGLKPSPRTAGARPRVRPLTGARIETPLDVRREPWLMFAPSRGRGLKLRLMFRARAGSCVRPLTGARIETRQGLRRIGRRRRFAPSRGRGLKRGAAGLRVVEAAFAPSRGRGLKPRTFAPGRDAAFVRPLTGARIETGPSPAASTKPRCSPPHGGAD